MRVPRAGLRVSRPHPLEPTPKITRACFLVSSVDKFRCACSATVFRKSDYCFISFYFINSLFTPFPVFAPFHLGKSEFGKTGMRMRPESLGIIAVEHGLPFVNFQSSARKGFRIKVYF